MYGNISIDSETLLMTDFVNLKMNLAQSLKKYLYV
jgi:hypothetical protein